MTDQFLVYSYAEWIKRHILVHMKTNNLIDLIELLLKFEDVEQDLRLEDGEVFNSKGEIITL